MKNDKLKELLENWDEGTKYGQERILEIKKAYVIGRTGGTTIGRKTTSELRLRLQQLFDLPMYENGGGWITSFTKDQFHNSVKRCMEILDTLSEGDK